MEHLHSLAFCCKHFVSVMIHTCISVCVCVCVCVRERGSIMNCKSTHLCMSICMHTCDCVCVCVCACMVYECVCIRMCVYDFFSMCK
jgi:hypothetical protein